MMSIRPPLSLAGASSAVVAFRPHGHGQGHDKARSSKPLTASQALLLPGLVSLVAYNHQTDSGGAAAASSGDQTLSLERRRSLRKAKLPPHNLPESFLESLREVVGEGNVDLDLER